MSSDRCEYPTDLTDGQWKVIAPMLPKPARTGRPRKVTFREIVNGILYMVRGGNAWRLLPHDFPKWKTVYTYFRVWRISGLWQKIHDVLREKTRRHAGRKSTPTAAVVDSQSVKTTEKGGCAGATMRGKK